jgi:HNH endonuclease
MAIAYSTPVLPLVQPVPPEEAACVDLLRRYCPGLAVHTHAQVAAHVHVDARGCWPWDGRVNMDGYGYVWSAGPWDDTITWLVHRYMFDTLVGPIPAGHHIHHRCHTRDCWHPLHLEEVTPKEHAARHPRVHERAA